MGWISLIIILIISPFVLYFRGIDMKRFTSKRLLAVYILLLVGALLMSYRSLHTVNQQAKTSIYQQLPVLSLLEKKSPDDYKKFITRYDDLMKSNKKNEAANLAGQFISKEFVKFTSQASNKSLYQCVKTRLKLYQAAYKINPALVVAIDAGTAIPAISNAQQKIALTIIMGENLQAEIAVIESAINTPQTTPTPADITQAQATLNTLGTQLSKIYGNQTVQLAFSNPANPSLNQGTVAKILVYFYSGLESLGENKAALVMKYMISPH